MVNDKSVFTSPETPSESAPAECRVPFGKSRPMRFFIMLGHGLLWAVILGVLAFLYGLYVVATGATTGIIISLIALAATSIFLMVLSWHYRWYAALVNYELGVSGLWIGYFMGSIRLTSLVDIEWFCTVFWPWAILAFVGGLLVASPHERIADSKWARTLRVCASVVLVVASGLLVCGFTRLLLFENRPIATFLALRTFSLQDIAFSPDGNTVATIGGCNGEERVARLWDAITGSSKGSFKEEQDKDSKLNPKSAAVQFIGAPLALAVASYSSEFGSGKLAIRVWDITSGQVQHSFQWDDDLLIRKPVFSNDGNLFVYCGRDGHIRVFDLRVGRLTIELDRNKGNIRCVAITPTCDALACATDDGTIEIWDVVNARQKRVVSIDHPVASMSLSPDGRLLACGKEDGCVGIIDVDGIQETMTIPCFKDGSVHAVIFSSNGRMLACGGGEQGFTKVVDTHRWEIVATLRIWGGWHPTCLAFSSDDKRLATGDALTRVAIWDMMSLKP